MSGPMTPAMNIQRRPIGQTRKPMGDERVPMSSEPIQRSQASARILESLKRGVPPSQLAQRPGYTPRPGKGDALPSGIQAPPQQEPQRPPPQPATRSIEVPPQPQGVPMPRPRPAGAPTQSDLDPRAVALRDAFIKSRGLTPAGTEPPDERQIMLEDAKQRLAQLMVAQRSGGGSQTAPATRGVVTPPASASVATPAPPPAQTFRPITGPSSEYVIRAPELEGKAGKKDKPQKVSKEKGSTPNYYAILGVEAGDNTTAAQKLQKLRARFKDDPGSLSREEYELVASTFNLKDQTYNKSREEGAIRQFFEKAHEGGEVPPEKLKGKGPKDSSRVSHTGPTEGGSYATKVPVEGSVADRFMADPAQAVAQAYIAQAGVPKAPRLPTQESVNEQKEFNTETEGED